MTLSIDRRQLMLASLALGAAGGAAAQAAAAPHPDLALKLMIVGRRRPGTTLAEHRHHIRRVHGELVVQNIAADPANAPRRYVQNPVFDGTFRAVTAGAADPFALNRDFVTQIWFPDLPSLGRARQSAFYLEKVKHDEDNFVDQASVVFMPVRERVISGAAVARTRASSCSASCSVRPARRPRISAAPGPRRPRPWVPAHCAMPRTTRCRRRWARRPWTASMSSGSTTRPAHAPSSRAGRPGWPTRWCAPGSRPRAATSRCSRTKT